MTSVNFLELEITGKCGLRCAHCYAESSPRGDHSPMAAADWERVIDDAKTAGIGTVQFIEQSLADILDGPRWRDILACIPPRDACVTCTPADSNDCDPSRKPRMAE
ncbi:MAG: hypothetical protein ABIZ05_13195 [Pseudonocardiaceae bacterium]